MKKLLALLMLLPATGWAQDDPTATMDMYGCYVYTLRTYINGKSGVDKMKTAATNSKKNKTVYVAKQLHTAGLPDSIDGYAVKYVDLNANAVNLARELKKKTASVVYMSQLSYGADTCTLWLMPITFKKEGDVTEPEYSELGCMFYYYFNKTTNKMGFAKAVCR